MAKARYTSGLNSSDFSKLKCIPADQFSLYNLPNENFANSIGILFEQCGGKYQAEKDLPEGYDPAQIQANLTLPGGFDSIFSDSNSLFGSNQVDSSSLLDIP